MSIKMPRALTITLFISALVLAGVFLFLWQSQKSATNAKQASIDATQTEMADLKKRLTELKSDLAKQTNPTPKTEPEPVVDDEAQIKHATKAYVHAQVGSESATLSVNLTKRLDNFARVSVSTGEVGYACVLKKSDQIWLVIFCGQSSPVQDELNRWGVPLKIVEGL